MIKIEKARLKEPVDVEDRILWGVAYDSGEQMVNGRKWETRLALDDLGWLHIWRTNSEGTRKARVPPDMIRAAWDADPDLLNELGAEDPKDRGDSIAPVSIDPAFKHPKAIRK